MDFSGCHFDYCGKSSRDYGLVFANANTSRFISLAGEVGTLSIFNRREKKLHYIGESFADSPIQFDAEVVTDDDRVIQNDERRAIEKWLFHQPNYQKLYMDVTDDVLQEGYEYVDGEMKRLYLNCRFTNPKKIEDGNGIRGYQFTVECDSYLAWQDATEVSFELNHDSESSNSIITVTVDTDNNDYVYPKVIFSIGSVGGDVIISNNTDETSRLTSFLDVPANTQVIMDGRFNYISGQNYERFNARNFIRLLDGDNSISIIGNVASISFEWNNRRYL